MITAQMFRVTRHAKKRFGQRFGFPTCHADFVCHMASTCKPAKQTVSRFVNKRCPKTCHKLGSGNWVYLMSAEVVNGYQPLFVCHTSRPAIYTIVTVLRYPTTENSGKPKAAKIESTGFKNAVAVINNVMRSMFSRSETEINKHTVPLYQELALLAVDLDDLVERLPGERKFMMWSLGLKQLVARLNMLSNKPTGTDVFKISYWHSIAVQVIAAHDWLTLLRESAKSNHKLAAATAKAARLNPKQVLTQPTLPFEEPLPTPK